MRFWLLFFAIIVASWCRKVLFINELERLVNEKDKKLLRDLIEDKDMIRSEKLKRLNEILRRQTKEIQEKYQEIISKEIINENEKIKKEAAKAKRQGYSDLLAQKETIEGDMSISENTAAKMEKEYIEKLSPKRKKIYYSLKGKKSRMFAAISLIQIIIYLYMIH